METGPKWLRDTVFGLCLGIGFAVGWNVVNLIGALFHAPTGLH